MTQKKSKKPSVTSLVLEFIKLQISGNILFLGTLLGFLIGDTLLGAPSIPTLIVAGIIANFFFFLANRDWVFARTARGHAKRQVWRFCAFMIFNFFLNIILIELFAQLLRQHPIAPLTAVLYSVWEFAIGWIGPLFAATADNWQHYVAQFLSGLCFTVWSFVGLRFWVFAPIKSHAKSAHHAGITLHTKRVRRRVHSNV